MNSRSDVVAGNCAEALPSLPAVSETTYPLPPLMMRISVPGGNVPAGALTVTRPSPSGNENVSARGLPITFDSDDEESFLTSSKQSDPRGDQYRSMGSMLGGNSTATRWAEWNLAKGLDTHLLKVRVTVPMAFVETSGGFMMGSASYKVTPAPRLARDVTRFAFRREHDAARVRLDQHLMLAPDMVSLETLSKKTDNSGGLGAALGLLGSAQTAGEFRLNADPARYEAEVLAASRASFSAFGSVLRSKRQGP